MKSLIEQLESVQKAIESAEKNQEYEWETKSSRRKHRKADLAVLYKREERLLALIAREERGSIIQGVPSR